MKEFACIAEARAHYRSEGFGTVSTTPLPPGVQSGSVALMLHADGRTIEIIKRGLLDVRVREWRQER